MNHHLFELSLHSAIHFAENRCKLVAVPAVKSVTAAFEVVDA